MSDASYSLALNDLFTSHGPQTGGLVQDFDLQVDQMQFEALVASGDCFVTLATEVDKISESLAKTDSKYTKLELEKLTRVLLYLQQHYKVVSKKKSPLL